MDCRTALLAAAAEYQRSRKLSQARVSTLVFNDGKRLGAIQAGKDFTVGSFERAIQWFSDHWPDDAVWPEIVGRPALTETPAPTQERAA